MEFKQQVSLGASIGVSEDILAVPLIETNPFERPRESWGRRRRRLRRARKAKLPWFQFRLAAMLRLVAVVSVLFWACFVVWPRWSSYFHGQKKLHLALCDVGKMGGVFSGWGRNIDLSTDGMARFHANRSPAPKHTPVSDAGLACLRRVPNLVDLDLSGQPITDGGLIHLQALPSLRRLVLVDTNVTGIGVAKLKKTLPNCKIVRRFTLDPDKYREAEAPVLPDNEFIPHLGE